MDKHLYYGIDLGKATQEVSRHQLTQVQFYLLAFLAEYFDSHPEGETTVKHLASITGLARGAIGKNIKALVKYGYIRAEQRQNTNGQNSYHIWLNRQESTELQIVRRKTDELPSLPATTEPLSISVITQQLMAMANQSENLAAKGMYYTFYTDEQRTWGNDKTYVTIYRTSEKE